MSLKKIEISALNISLKGHDNRDKYLNQAENPGSLETKNLSDQWPQAIRLIVLVP